MSLQSQILESSCGKYCVDDVDVSGKLRAREIATEESAGRSEPPHQEAGEENGTGGILWAPRWRAFHAGCPAKESRAAKPRSGCSTGSNSKSVNKTPLAVIPTPPRERPKSASQVMKNKLKSVRRGSKSASASQPKTIRPRAVSAAPSCLCLFDAGVGELAGEIPLVGKELPYVVIAACRQGITADQFIANAIKEKLRRDSSRCITSQPNQIAVQVLANLAVRKVHDCPIDERNLHLAGPQLKSSPTAPPASMPASSPG